MYVPSSPLRFLIAVNVDRWLGYKFCTLERWNGNSLWLFLSSRIFFGEPVPTSPENALVSECPRWEPLSPKARRNPNTS
jgi:hypothetical protein